MLGYFGCDQSQVQRYLTARSVDAARHSLLMSAFAKIPLQLLILLTGVLVFVFYLFETPPMLFNPGPRRAGAGQRAGPRVSSPSERSSSGPTRRAGRRPGRRAGGASQRGRDPVSPPSPRRRSGHRSTRGDARPRGAALVRDVTGDASYTDVNYVFPTFITTRLPVGLVGLMIAAIFAAAMSSIAAELNALSAATVMDFYRRHYRTAASDRHYLRVSKLATGFWGLFASVTALYAANLGSLIEVVNRFGSYFYGSLLGVFVLAIGFPRATATGAFWGMVGGMASVMLVAGNTSVSFLWLNLVGAVAVFVLGAFLSLVGPDPARARGDDGDSALP